MGRVSLPFSDDFEGGCKWPEEESERFLLDCANGSYHLWSKKDRGQAAQLGFKDSYSWVRVQADGRASAEDAAFGIGCWTSDGKQGYIFAVGRDGSWAVVRDSVDAGPQVLESRGSDAIVVNERSTRLRADCAVLKLQAKLRFAVNGEVLAVVDDDDPVSSFGSFGFDAYSGTDAYFDNATARELEIDEALALEKAEEGVAEPAPSPVEPVETLVVEDFSQASSSWPDDKEAGFAQGRYRLRTPRDGSALVISQKVPLTVFRLQIDVDATQVTRGTGQQHGVSCLTRGGDGYSFALQPDERRWRISRVSAGGVEELMSSADVPAVRRPPKRNHLQTICDVFEGQVALTLLVNGRKVTEWTDSADLDPLDSFSLDLQPGTKAGEVFFDELVVGGA